MTTTVKRRRVQPLIPPSVTDGRIVVVDGGDGPWYVRIADDTKDRDDWHRELIRSLEHLGDRFDYRSIRDGVGVTAVVLEPVSLGDDAGTLTANVWCRDRAAAMLVRLALS